MHRHARLQPGLAVTYLSVSVPQLNHELENFRIAHISDLHVGEKDWMPFRAEEAALTVRQERPDVVVNTGDFLMEEPSSAKVSRLVARFVVPPVDGQPSPESMAILGNHDYYASESTVASLTGTLERLGIHLLTNRFMTLERGSGRITFAGLVSDQPGFDEALSHLTQTPRPRVVLIHEPDLAERLAPGAADIILAGHSHGGQIAIPGLTKHIVWRVSGSRYVGGMYTVNGNRMYVNRGLGCTGLPVRFRASPELTMLQFVR